MSAADSGSTSAVCGDIAAIDGDGAARTVISAADSGCKRSSGCGDIAAVDGDGACILPASATDPSLVHIFILSCQNAHSSIC